MQLLAGRPALKQIVSEAARALARLDAARLEELALSCQALNRDLTRDSARDSARDLASEANSGPLPIKEAEQARLVAEARGARREMDLFAGVLEATRANVQVIARLREQRLGTLEYSVGQTADFDGRWPSTENGHGESRHGNH
jgi:hypothetical protein